MQHLHEAFALFLLKILYLLIVFVYKRGTWTQANIPFRRTVICLCYHFCCHLCYYPALLEVVFYYFTNTN